MDKSGSSEAKLTPGELLAKNCHDQTVGIITSDGRYFVGTLKGMDRGTNVILADSHERIFSPSQGVEKEQQAECCIIRGENVALIGEIDNELDLQLDLKKCKAKPIKAVVH